MNERTGTADALQKVWGATTPANLAPEIEDIRGVPKSSMAAGDTFKASVRSTDPDGDPLVWKWTVLPEHNGRHSHTRTSMPNPVSSAIAHVSGDGVSVKAPDKPGVYRLYAWVKDDKGNVATANAPFEVR